MNADPDVISILKNHPKVIANPELLDGMVAEYYQTKDFIPPMLAPQNLLDQIPEYMRRQKRWTVFRKIWDEGRKKFDKYPCTPVGGDPYPGYPNPENQNDFGHFTDIRKLCELDNSFAPAFYLLKKDRILFLDFDQPCEMPDYPTYTERSISGGYHVLGYFDGAKPVLKDTKEIYQDRRWVIPTGDIVNGRMDINDVTDLIVERQGTTPTATPRFKVQEVIPSGERNNVLFKYGSSMRAKGSSGEAIEAALLVENKIRCNPPLPESEVKTIAASAGKFSPGPVPTLAQGKGTTATDITKKKVYAGHSSGEFKKVQEALDAIIQVYNNPVPRMFVRSGKLCRVIYDENGTPSIDKLDESSLSVILTQCIEWYTVQEITVEKRDGDEKKKEKKQIEVITTTPPMLVTRLYALGQWEGLPALSGIVESPYITDNGEIVSVPGYNPQTRLYLAQHQNFKGITVPDAPNEQDIVIAKKKLFDLFDEFTFEEDASRENHIACLITAAIRPTIKGLVPLIVYDKPVMGSGASLLAEIIAGVTTGRPASMTQAPDNNTEGEWNKLIIGLLREGRSLNIFDNVEGDIYSAALAAVLTAQVYRGRILGKNATEEYPNNALWIANGNNVQVTHDLPRRCVWVRLATDTARPYERTDWKIQNIREHAVEHQSEYLSAILTIVKGWYLAGKPQPSRTLQVMGSFEKWRDVLGGIMKFIHCDNFLCNTSMNLDIAEEAHEDIEIFLEEIFCAFPSKEGVRPDGRKYSRLFSLKEITPVEDQGNYVVGNTGVRVDRMPAYLQEIQREHPKKLPYTIGNQFKKLIGKVFPLGYRLERGKMVGKVATYHISLKSPITKFEQPFEVRS